MRPARTETQLLLASILCTSLRQSESPLLSLRARGEANHSTLCTKGDKTMKTTKIIMLACILLYMMAHPALAQNV